MTIHDSRFESVAYYVVAATDAVKQVKEHKHAGWVLLNLFQNHGIRGE